MSPSWVTVLTTVALISVGCNVGEDTSIATRSDAPSPLNTSSPPTILTVNAIDPTRVENAERTIFFFGRLSAKRRSRLGFARGGRVERVLKTLGDRASKGELLAELDQDELKLQKRSLEQSLQRATQNVQDVTAGAGSLRLQVQQLETELAAVNTELAKGVIVAPYACVVTETSIDAGSQVSPAIPMLQVIEDAQPLIEASLPERYASLLSSDQMIQVELGGTFYPASVEAISPLRDAASGQRVRLEFSANLTRELWSYGRGVEMRFQALTSDSGVWLPLSALTRQADASWSVLVVRRDPSGSASMVERRILNVVRLADEAALVQASINDQELVIVDGTHRIVPGQRVRVVDISRQFAAGRKQGIAE